MAVNEEIVTGKKFRRLIDIATNKWRRYSFWNKAKDTECEDGTDVETKVGAIKGITTSTNVSETGYAADAKTVSEINQSLTWKQVKTEGKYFDFSNINYKEIHIIAYYNNYRVSCSFTQDDNGNYYFGSNEPGWVGAVIIKDNTNKDISLQNFLLSGSDVTIDANIAVYYR